MDDAPSGTPDFYASLPTKHVAAGWLFRDTAGRVLLVEPTYKENWEIPGGSTELNESPAETARRELREELGIDREPGRLLCVDWRAAVPDVRGDRLLFVFDGGIVDDEFCSEIDLDISELRAWHFVEAEDLDLHVIPAMARRLRACLATEPTGYLEDGLALS